MYCKIVERLLHRKKTFPMFPSPAGMSLNIINKPSLGGNNDIIYKLFPPRRSLVSDIPARDGNIKKLFLQCTVRGQSYVSYFQNIDPPPPSPPGECTIYVHMNSKINNPARILYSHGALFRHICTFPSGGVSTRGS
jgi:hypothetical protein